jgi:2-methylcitrate dehydratase
MTTALFAVDALAEFVVAADSTNLPDDAATTLLRRNVLDSIGCAIAALDGETVRLVREQVESVGGLPRASLIGGGRSSVDQAALFNSVAVRYVDLLDTYLTPGGLCHPADNFGALLAVAESVGASGTEFLLALAVAYEVQCRFSAAVPVMARGLNHALQLAMSVAAGTARLSGLTVEQTANAIAIAAADNVSLAAIHSEPVSNWKGISPGITAQRAVYATGLAQRGITGPRGIIDGPNGLEQLFDQPIDLHLDDPTLGVVRHTYLKKYCALIHGQAPIETVLTLSAVHGIDHHDIAAVDVAVFQTAYDIAGGGRFGDKDAPQTKEQADYNLKYLLAVALIDGGVGPEQLQTERIRRPDVQELLRRITVRPDPDLTARYPGATPVRIVVTLRDGRQVSRAQDDFHGAPSRPFTWERTVEKFHWLATPFADLRLRRAIVDAVDGLGHAPVSALTELLTAVGRIRGEQLAADTRLGEIRGQRAT